MKRSGIISLFILFALTFTGCSNTGEETAQPDTSESSVASEADNETEAKENNGSFVQTQFILENKDNPQYVIVDTRLNDAYNGWKVNGIARGGHIPDAVDFSANWLSIEKDGKEEILQEALKAKGITPDKSVILYDDDIKNAEKVRQYLAENNYNDIFIYDFNEWIDDDSLELVRYENYHLIVPAYIINEILEGGYPETFENASSIKIVESSWGEEKESYQKGHIPTAFHIDTDSFEPPPQWMLDSDENLRDWALSYGFHVDDTVIVSSADQMAAYRLAVVLRYVGVLDVRVLNGGNDAWTAAGYTLENESHMPEPAEDFGTEIPGNPALIVSISQLKDYLQNPDEYILVDNRGWDEFIGESSGYSYHNEKGRIPGAVFGYAGEFGSGDLSYYRNIDNTVRNQKEIEQLWHSQFIDTDKHMMFMCGSGWRVAEILTYANVFGYENCSIYSDGWIGWSNDPENPKEVGEPL